jgi:hypothetical protein
MNLPIKWRVLPGPFSGHMLITAQLEHEGVHYNKRMAMSPSFSRMTWWLTVAAMKAEIENAVVQKDPPAV